MRITGGIHRGRLLKAPPTGLRPTQDRVRSALFSALATVVPGARVLDLFSGTGSLGLEAWSRGAEAVDFVESAAPTLRMLKANIAALRMPPAVGRVIPADVFRFLDGPPRSPHAPYRIILADPPYAIAREHRYMARIATLLAAAGWLESPAFFVFETEGRDPLEALPSFDLALDREYGATRLLVWRHA